MSEHKIKEQRKLMEDAVRKEREILEVEIRDYVNNAPFKERLQFAWLALRGKI
jgi:hypothetical protein